jgi:hypothetical protein
MASDSFSFDVLAAELRRDSHDLDTFHEVLAEKLAQSLPEGQVEVRRGGLPFQAKRPLTQLRIHLGDLLFQADHTAHGFEYRVAKMVRGIALKTDIAAFDAWMDGLARALYEQASASESVREALERFLTGG